MNKKRLTVLYVVVALMLVLILLRLFSMQAIHGESYYQMSQQKVSSTTVEKAPRGEILDRYGRPLVSNRMGYSIQVKKTGLSNDDLNQMLLKLLHLLENNGSQYQDQLPISQNPPFEFAFQDENGDGSTEDEKEKWFSDRKKITKDMSAEEIITYYKDRVYSITDGFSPEDLRRLIGFRYDAALGGFSAVNAYTVAEDVSMETVTQIKERQNEFKGVSVVKEYYRTYDYETLAAHILGGIGKMNAEEYQEMKNDGYGFNDLIGKRGIEKVLEKNLRGTDGKTNVIRDIGASDEVSSISAVPGNYAVLTIDTDLQKAAEDSLAKHVAQISTADAGAAVVLDVTNGDVLAMANYPTYNPASFNQDYAELVQNSAKPIWNRAISGTYTPGSTLKPLIAISALESGAVTLNQQIVCNGIYDYYADYKPKCWIWSESHRTHGPQNVTQAIKNSCNCYFYEAGRLTGIDEMDRYAAEYGLGERTGIELPDESTGQMSSPAYKEKIGTTPEDQKWYPGDVIQTSIGQSYSFFTPIQLANYIAMIANGGTRYQPHLIKSIRSSEDGSVVSETKANILNQAEIQESTLKAVREGMYGVVDEGSASKTFANYPIELAGKTGTAQVGKDKANNALFVAFAPYDNPEIAVAVVLEKGEKGYNAAGVAKDIMDEYFGLNKEKNEVVNYYDLLP